MILANQIKFIGSSVLDIVFPNDCAICNTHLLHNENYLCLNCRFDLPYINQSQNYQDSLQKLFLGRVNVERVYSLLNYQKGNQTQTLLHLLKYHDKTKLATYLGERLGAVIPNPKQFDFIIPVPLHPKKQRKRGYNQSTVIGNGVNQKLNVPLNEKILFRSTHNKSQTNYTKYDRWDNVNTIFKVKKPKLLENKHILLIDDVLTTGATIEACVKELLKSKGCKVSIATLAARI